MYVSGRLENVLVDTGASVSIMSTGLASPDDIFPGKVVRVHGYDGTARVLDKWTRVEVEYQGSKVLVEALLIDDAKFNFILARPDMKRLRLNLSWKDEVLVDHPTETICAQTKPPIRLVTDSENVCSQYPELLCVGTYPPAAAVMEVPFQLRDVTAVRKKPYGMSYEKKKWLKAELQSLLEYRIIRPSVSTFASPITMVLKDDGTYRLCTDYRLVNRQTDLFPYPMPRIDDIINETGGCSWFSRVDLCKGYWQVPLQEEYKHFTAFVTPFGTYEYNRLPFGWKNSGAWFQKMMDTILQEFTGQFCGVYVDDIIIYSRSRDEHISHLSQVLDALSKAKLKINFKKSEFFKNSVVFLGRVFDGKRKAQKRNPSGEFYSYASPMTCILYASS